MSKKSNAYLHAKRELDILLKNVEEPVVAPFINEILALVDKFGNSGQSGGSAPYVASALGQIVEQLCLQKTICPIQGTEDEWFEVYEMMQDDGCKVFQNNRESAVFKECEDGIPYFLDGIVWREYINIDGRLVPTGFTGNVEGIHSSRYIKNFPFTPKVFYIDVEKIPVEADWEEEEPFHEDRDGRKYRYSIKDRTQLEQVWEIYSESEVLKQ